MESVYNEIIASQDKKQKIIYSQYVKLSSSDKEFLLTLVNKRRLSLGGNMKINNNVGLFNLIPLHDCVDCSECGGTCYAIQAYCTYKNTRDNRNINSLIARKHPNLLRYLIVKQILEDNINIVRPHESGDFFNQEYLNLWVDIAAIVRKYCTFYGYTKARKKLDFNQADSLSNFNMIDSFIDGNILNYGTKEHCEMLESGNGCFICPDSKREKHNRNDKICMNTCSYCLNNSKPCFIIHGMFANKYETRTVADSYEMVRFANLTEQEKNKEKPERAIKIAKDRAKREAKAAKYQALMA